MSDYDSEIAALAKMTAEELADKFPEMGPTLLTAHSGAGKVAPVTVNHSPFEGFIVLIDELDPDIPF